MWIILYDTKEKIMNFHFDHFNINVTDLDRSIAFYKEALDLEVVGSIERPTYRIVYLSRPGENFRLELTYLYDKKGSYELGDNESHLAFVTDDYPGAHKKHEKMGCICFENPEIGIYFINDPDDYWIEILPPRELN